MKFIQLFVLSMVCILLGNSQQAYSEGAVSLPFRFSISSLARETPGINLQAQPGDGKMRSIVFKEQKYCRAELKNFEFDAHFSIVSASVYFSGANFKEVEKGYITSSSLQPVKDKMTRCQPGTIVVFDDVKVVGPDKIIRTIEGLSLLLY